MKLEDMKPGMRVTFTPPGHSDVRLYGQVGQLIENEKKIIRFDDGTTCFLNEAAAEHFELTPLN